MCISSIFFLISQVFPIKACVIMDWEIQSQLPVSFFIGHSIGIDHLIPRSAFWIEWLFLLVREQPKHKLIKNILPPKISPFATSLNRWCFFHANTFLKRLKLMCQIKNNALTNVKNKVNYNFPEQVLKVCHKLHFSC